LCTQHRDWGWSPGAVSPRAQRGQGQRVWEWRHQINSRTEETSDLIPWINHRYLAAEDFPPFWGRRWRTESHSMT
jgi:hypothetical protein